MPDLDVEYTYTTGVSQLPDVGELSYNGVDFSPFFETKVRGKMVRDEANRTIKYMEYTLSVDGYVTLPGGASTIAPAMNTLRRLLTQQAGPLIYKGRGLDLIVNAGGAGGQGGNQGGGGSGSSGNITSKLSVEGRDVAWGPVPELIEFQPLGAGRSAKVQWRCTVRIPEVKQKGPFLQLNYETSVGYGEDGFSQLGIRGTMEVPLTRSSVNDRSVPYTVDQYRLILDDAVLRGIDLNKFRVVRRDFNISRDKRTMTFDIGVEEKPYMDLPIWCNLAHGNYTVRPTKVGAGLASWLCTLRCTYNVRNDKMRRIAWAAFLDLLRLRMREGNRNDIPLPGMTGTQSKTPFLKKLFYSSPPGVLLHLFGKLLPSTPKVQTLDTVNKDRKVWLIDFNIDEGIYLDSKKIGFSATWRLNCAFEHILLASGVWRKLKEVDSDGKSYWATSMQDPSTPNNPVLGSKSWLPNEVNPKLDVIVDFGGPNAF